MPDSQTDHHADEGREVGNLEDVARQDHERTADPDAEQSDGDRQAHRQHGAERDDQDDDGKRQTEQLGRRLFELGEEEAAHLDTEALDVGDQVANLVTDLGGAGEVDVLGQVDGRVRDLSRRIAPAGDLELAARVIGTLHGDDVVDGRNLGEHRLHRVLHLGVVHTLFGLEDDLTGLGRTAAVGELRLDQREAFGRLEACEREVLAVRIADRVGDAVASHQRDDPEHDHELAVIVTPRSEAAEHGSSLRLAVGEDSLGRGLRRY